MHHHFQTTQFLPHPVDLVFAFFANPENLPRLMPRWQRARIEEASFAPPPPRPAGSRRFPGIAAGDGTRMTISFRPVPFSPIRVPWDAEISGFCWNEGFCDTQSRGPFAFWHHCHSVAAETRDGIDGTLLTDKVEFALPLGPLGDFAARTAAPLQFQYIFRYRQARTAELLALLTRRQK